MCHCYIKERNQSNSPWCHLTKPEPRFELPTSHSQYPLLSCVHLLSVPAWSLSRESVPVLLSVSMSVSFPGKGLCSVIIEQHRKHHWRRNEGYFTETFNRVSQGIKPLTPTDPNWPNNIQYCKHHLSSNSQMMCSTYTVDMHATILLSTSVFAVFSKWYTHITPSQRHRRVHNLRLQLCINLSCKIWLHRKSKANEFNLQCSLKDRFKQTGWIHGRIAVWSLKWL